MKHWLFVVLGLVSIVGCASTTEDASTDEATADLTGGAQGTCTSTFGKGLSGSNGRLDGTVYAVVPPTRSHACNGDSDHVHVQVKAQGSVYDVAVNTHGVGMVEKDVADAAKLPGGAWAEGWHRGTSVSYTSDLKLRSNTFGSMRDVSGDFEDALATAKNVSVYAWLYNKGGIHLVHKSRSSDADGAFVIQDTAGAKVYAFRFSNQSF